MIHVDAQLPSFDAAKRWGSKRPLTKAIIVHRIGGHIVRPGGGLETMLTAASVERFFRLHPHGVATTQLSGSWKSKLPIIERWEANGVPAVKRIKAFVPYHFLVDPEGLVWESCPIDIIGMHAASRVSGVPGNSDSVGIGVIGNFRSANELAAWEVKAGVPVMAPTPEQEKALRQLMRDLLVVYPKATVMTHDEQRADQGRDPKGCPGLQLAPLIPEMASWALLASRHILDGEGRR